MGLTRVQRGEIVEILVVYQGCRFNVVLSYQIENHEVFD
jgi:hypothetical protein